MVSNQCQEPSAARMRNVAGSKESRVLLVTSSKIVSAYPRSSGWTREKIPPSGSIPLGHPSIFIPASPGDSQLPSLATSEIMEGACSTIARNRCSPNSIFSSATRSAVTSRMKPTNSSVLSGPPCAVVIVSSTAMVAPSARMAGSSRRSPITRFSPVSTYRRSPSM
ncbi:unannotated protein [freshwater metagenome]|uniref:Unannotated protein n=1 Tax=freshwater metagenome TaxID=449393 RepID=A0A6J6WYK3_9ZZZZ